MSQRSDVSLKAGLAQKPKVLLVVGAGLALVACCGILVAIGAIGKNNKGGMVTASATPSPVIAAAELAGTSTASATIVPATVTPAATGTLSPADALAALARQQFGSRLATADLTEMDGQTIASIVYDLGPQWDEGSSVLTAASDFMAFAPKAFQQGIDVLEVTSTSDFVDVYGNEAKERAFKFSMGHETAAKINWSNVNMHNIARLLANPPDYFEVHPALLKAWLQFVNQ